MRVLQRRPANLVDTWHAGRYRRAMETAQGLALIEVENRGTIDAPDVRWVVRHADSSAATRVLLVHKMRRVLGLDVEPAALQQLSGSCARLRPILLALRGMRPPRFADLFETFANVVPFQQVSLDAGVAIVGRLVARFGAVLEHEGGRFHAFPTAEAVAGARIERLRECGLSASKSTSLKAVARAIAAGELSEDRISRMSTNDAIRSLTALRGIGPWSASLVLLRGFGRLDVFPPHDVGAAQGLRALLRVQSQASLERMVDRCGNYRGLLYFSSLGAKLLAKGLVHPAPPPAR